MGNVYWIMYGNACDVVLQNDCVIFENALRLLETTQNATVMISPPPEFLKHKSISNITGGFHLKLNGIRVLKHWGYLDKMKTRERMEDVLFDLGDYMQVHKCYYFKQ